MALANPVNTDEFAVGTEEDHETLKQLVMDLFKVREDREIDVEVDEDGVASNSAVDTVDTDKLAVDGEPKVVEDPAEIARFNNYMDAVYRRMNAAVRAKMMDPMVLNLSNGKSDKKSSTSAEKKGKKADKKDKKKKKRKSRNLTDEDHENTDVEMTENEEMVDADENVDAVVDASVGRKMAKNDKKKNAKSKKGKNKASRGKMSPSERKAARAERKKQRKASGGQADKKKNRKANGKKGGDKKAKGKKNKDHKQENRESRGQKEEAMARSRRNKHSKGEKEGKKLAKGKKDDFSGKSMGSLAGIATLRRSGDVALLDAGNHKIVKSEFSIGPLQLEVSKTFGNGKSRSVKTAKAVTEELIGKITLKVKPDGSAHVKSVSFKKPENVEIRGSLGDQKKRSDNYLKSSVGKIRPMAAQRLLKMARYVLKSPSTVERS